MTGADERLTRNTVKEQKGGNRGQSGERQMRGQVNPNAERKAEERRLVRFQRGETASAACGAQKLLYNLQNLNHPRKTLMHLSV